MPNPIINGKRGAYLQPPRYGFDQSGPYTIFTWHGTKIECLSNVPAIRAAGGLWEMQESFSGAKCELTARFARDFSNPNSSPPPEDLESTWELFSNPHEKDILESDNAVLNNITDDEKRMIRDAIQNPVAGQSPAVTTAGAIDLYLLMLNGLRTVKIDVPTLRHSQQASTEYALPDSLTFVGRIFTTAALIKVEPSMPADLASNLPDYGSSRTNLGYGWRKDFPNITLAAKQKRRLTQEYVFGLWPTSPAIYGDFILP